MTGDSDEPKRVAALDANVLIRVALAKTRVARAIRAAWEEGDFLFLISEDILKELGRVLRYPRIAERRALTELAISVSPPTPLSSFQPCFPSPAPVKHAN